MSDLRPRNYLIWEIEQTGTEFTRSWICLDMFAWPDDETMTTLRQSHFMYGFVRNGSGIESSDAGKAIWYAVATEESREWVVLLMAGAIFTPLGKRL